MLLELAQEIGLDPKRKASTHGGEYCSPCPKCGGDDRFILWPHKENSKVEGSYWCRICGINGDTIQFCRDFLSLDYTSALERCGVEGSPSHFPTKRFNIPEKDFRANNKWKAAMGDLVDMAKVSIEKSPDTIDILAKRGIPKAAIAVYGIGFLSNNTTFDRKDLGLPNAQDGKATLWIPKGITIPTFDNGKLIRLKVRRSDWKPNDTLPKYWEISGGLKGLNLIGDKSRETIIVVESELDAYAVHWSLQGKVLVIAVGSNTKHPDSLTHALVKNSSKLIILHDNDEAGEVMLNKWTGLYPKAIGASVSIGKDIGEAFERGYDVKSWLESFVTLQKKTFI